MEFAEFWSTLGAPKILSTLLEEYPEYAKLISEKIVSGEKPWRIKRKPPNKDILTTDIETIIEKFPVSEIEFKTLYEDKEIAYNAFIQRGDQEIYLHVHSPDYRGYKIDISDLSDSYNKILDKLGYSKDKFGNKLPIAFLDTDNLNNLKSMGIQAEYSPYDKVLKLDFRESERFVEEIKYYWNCTLLETATKLIPSLVSFYSGKYPLQEFKRSWMYRAFEKDYDHYLKLFALLFGETVYAKKEGIKRHAQNPEINKNVKKALEDYFLGPVPPEVLARVVIQFLTALKANTFDKVRTKTHEPIANLLRTYNLFLEDWTGINALEEVISGEEIERLTTTLYNLQKRPGFEEVFSKYEKLTGWEELNELVLKH